MSEAKLTFTTDIKDLERSNAKLVRDNAKLTESLRKVKAEAGSMGDAWTKQLKKTSQENDTFVAGLKRLEMQAKATKQAMQDALLADKGARFQSRQDTNLAIAAEMAKKLPVIRAEATKTRTAILSLGAAGRGEFGDMLTSLVGTVAVVGTVTAAYRQWRSEIEAMGGAHRAFASGLTAELTSANALMEGPRISAAVNAPGAGTPEQRLAALSGLREAAPLMGTDRRLALMQEAAKQAPTGIDLKAFGGLMGAVGDIMPGKSAGDVADLSAALQAKAGAGAERLGGDKFLRAVKSQVAAGKSPEEAFGFALAAMDANVSPDTITQAAIGGKPSREQAFQLRRVDPAAVAARTQELRDAQRTDLASSRLGALRSFPEGQTALAEQAVLEANVPGAAGAAAGSMQQTREQLRANAARRGFLPRVGQAANEFGTFLQDFHIMGGQSRLQARRAGIGREETEINRAERFGAISGDDAAKMRAAIEANTRAIQEANRQRGATNVNRHNEAAP